ncbi:hypothetical protein, partial [Helicobacter cetorum]|uniref:hypothetical protein n=1 Tax=Helicobacter cetorum TaxID=138563 RepID=UPI001315651D
MEKEDFRDFRLEEQNGETLLMRDKENNRFVFKRVKQNLADFVLERQFRVLHAIEHFCLNAPIKWINGGGGG